MPGTSGSRITVTGEPRRPPSPTPTSSSAFSNDEIGDSGAYVFQKGLCLLEIVTENGIRTKRVTCLACPNPAKGRGLWLNVPLADSSTGNYTRHYQKYHPLVASSRKGEERKRRLEDVCTNTDDTESAVSNRTDPWKLARLSAVNKTRGPKQWNSRLEEDYRRAAVDFIVSLNLPMRIVDTAAFARFMSFFDECVQSLKHRPS
jgi:hypothetical protein